MKKLTLVLVALLLAVTCVFVACGKKPTDTTPVDDTPKPADTTPVVEPTVTVEDMTPVAEQFKKDLAANYVDLYSKEVENAIDAEKAAALLKIMGASTKDEAQKIADDFIAFLKAQKTSYDVLKDLVAQIGDVALADEDLIKEAASYKKALDDAFAGTNEAKKAVLDAYKADEATQKAVADAATRLGVLKGVKATADTKATGENARIADLYKAFTADEKAFNLYDVNAYEKLVADINKLASDNKIEVGSDAYNEIFDVTTLAAAKAVLDAAIAADTTLVDMKAVVDAAAALEAAAEDARWKEYIDVDKDDLKAATDSTHTVQVDYNGTPMWAAAELADDAKEENVVTVEKVIALRYKLALKADVEAAQKVLNKLKTNYSAAKLTAYGYNKPGDVVKAAENSINTIAADYATSLAAAKTDFAAYFTTTQYVDVVPAKEDTIDVYTGFTSNPKATDYLTKLAKEIDDLKATFKTVDADGNKLSYPAGMLTTGDYVVDGAHNVYLVNGAPAVKYVAWTYGYELDGAALGGVTEFNALTVLRTSDNNATKAKAALKWLQMFIGDGDYADKYELKKDYGFTKDLIMVDRAIDEVATAKTTEINGKAVTTEKTAAVEAKVYSPYTVAKMLVAEQEKIAAAKDEAFEAIKAAALALRTAGDADAIKAAEDLYDAIEDGSYLNEKLYDKKAAALDAGYLALDLSGKEVVVFEKTAKEPEVKVVISTLIKTDAKNALNAVKTLAAADTSAVAGKYATMAADATALENFDKVIALYDLYIENAKAAYDAAVAGNAYSKYLVSDAAVAAAKDKYTAVDQIKNLLLNKVVFDDANDTTGTPKYVTIAAGAGNVASNKTNIKAVIDEFAPATSTEITVAMKDALADALANIAAEVADARNVLAATLKTSTKAFEDAFDAFEGYAAVDAAKAYTDRAAVKNALGKVKIFADNNKADYINLAYTVAFGEKVITFADPLTEIYRERLLAGNYDVIEAVVAYANTLDATAKTALDTTGAPTWKAAAQTRVGGTEVVIEAVASIKAAAELVKNYALSDGVYELDTALSLINGALKAASKPEITLTNLKAGITTSSYAW